MERRWSSAKIGRGNISKVGRKRRMIRHIGEGLCINVPDDALASIRVVCITCLFGFVPVMSVARSWVGRRSMHLHHFHMKLAKVIFMFDSIEFGVQVIQLSV
jgi:hypothetical protein